jgi:hypothetical protein
MSQEPNHTPVVSARSRFSLSLDWWAVITALILAALVLLGIIPSVPW